jgi:glyoxylase I family protein
MQFAHVALNCQDLAVTESFYRELFGFQPVRRIEAGETVVLFMRLGEARLELFAAEGVEPPAERDGPHQAGVMRHLAFQTDDLDAFASRLPKGVEVTLGPAAFDGFIPGWKTLWLRDPDGVIVEVSQGYVDAPSPLG